MRRMSQQRMSVAPVIGAPSANTANTGTRATVTVTVSVNVTVTVTVTAIITVTGDIHIAVKIAQKIDHN